MEAPELERRLAAIFAADVEGYSRLMHRDEEATMAALSVRRATVDRLIALHRGRIANTAGDSVLAEFASVLDAVSCAVEVQNAMEEANAAAGEPPMRFRIGINVGDVMVKDGDIFGDGVNVAARLEALAEGGGICVSRGVRDHLRHRTSLVFEDLGEQLIKNIAHPVRAYRLRVEERSDLAPSEAKAAGDAGVSAESAVALELALWDSVKDGSSDELASYLEHYPDGTFASLARTRQNSAEDAPAAEPHAAASSSKAEVTPQALDLAFWEAIKDSDQPADFAAYLERHSEGHFAALARARLARPEDDPGPAEHIDDAIELAFWEGVRDAADPDLLAAYLERYPEGQFAVIAQARLHAMRGTAAERETDGHEGQGGSGS